MEEHIPQKPYIIGIAGGSGSGKTFFLKCFLKHFAEHEITLVSQDDYYIPEYTFNNIALEPKLLEIKSAPIIIVEGLFIFHFEEINALLDHRIFIHAEEEVALERRLKRDLIERGYNQEDVTYKWNYHVLPAFNDYLLPYKKQCNQIIENNTNNEDNIVAITNDISAYLRQSFFN